MKLFLEAFLLLVPSTWLVAGLYVAAQANAYRLAKVLIRHRRRTDGTAPHNPDLAELLGRTEALAGLSRDLSAMHRSAKRWHMGYQFLQANSVASLAAGFSMFAAEVTILGQAEGIHGLVVAADLVGLGLALAYVAGAHVVAQAWLRRRTAAELFRHSWYLHAARLGAAGQGAKLEPYGPLATLREALPAHSEDLPVFVRQFWEAERSLFLGEPVGTDGDPGTLRDAYLSVRIETQKLWFRRSRKRLERSEALRGRLLKALFAIAVAAALVKAWGVVSHVHDSPVIDWASFAFLMCIGAATATTALFVNQNARSLIHRYRAQEALIEQCLERCSSGANRPATLAQVRVMVSDFEELMISELVDFLEISRRDLIEITP